MHPDPITRRVIFFGDSRAGWWLVPVLPGLQCVAAGVPGVSAPFLAQRFQAMVAPSRPDIVVVQMGVNVLTGLTPASRERERVVATTVYGPSGRPSVSCKPSRRFTRARKPSRRSKRATSAQECCTSPLRAVPYWSGSSLERLCGGWSWPPLQWRTTGTSRASHSRSGRERRRPTLQIVRALVALTLAAEDAGTAGRAIDSIVLAAPAIPLAAHRGHRRALRVYRGDAPIEACCRVAEAQGAVNMFVRLGVSYRAILRCTGAFRRWS